MEGLFPQFRKQKNPFERNSSSGGCVEELIAWKEVVDCFSRCLFWTRIWVSAIKGRIGYVENAAGNTGVKLSYHESLLAAGCHVSALHSRAISHTSVVIQVPISCVNFEEFDPRSRSKQINVW